MIIIVTIPIIGNKLYYLLVNKYVIIFNALKYYPTLSPTYRDSLNVDEKIKCIVSRQYRNEVKIKINHRKQ